MYQNAFGGFRPDPLRELTCSAAPDSLAGLNGEDKAIGQGTDKGERAGKGVRRGREGEGEGKERTPNVRSTLTPISEF